MNFASDNVYGVHPVIMDAIIAANQGTADSYAGDKITARVEARFDELFERKVDVFLVTTGTAANALAISTMTPPFGAVFAHSHAHVMLDECGAPEFFSGGAKMMPLAGVNGKISPQMVATAMAGFIRGEHDPKPSAISITQASELGTIYSLDEIAAFGDFASQNGLKLHMDGARFANALVGLGCTAAEMSWEAGVDVLSFGITKNGAMGVEAVVFFDGDLAADFVHRRMRAGQLLSKNRFLAAQVEAYLQDDLWLDNAATANRLAAKLAYGLEKTGNVRLALECEANEVFAIIPKAMSAYLEESGAVFHPWIASKDDMQHAGADEIVIRLVTSFATAETDIDQFVSLVQSA